MASVNASLSCSIENCSILASEDDGVVVHADEKHPALIWVGVRCDSQEIVVASVGWDFGRNELASFSIAIAALDSSFVKYLSIVTREVDATSDHANEKVLAAVFTS